MGSAVLFSLVSHTSRPFSLLLSTLYRSRWCLTSEVDTHPTNQCRLILPIGEDTNGIKYVIFAGVSPAR
jgi:hypothetical protein